MGRRHRLLPVGVIAASVSMLGCGSQQLGPDDLRQVRMGVHSTTAEGALLAQQVADGQVTDRFARVRAEELADELRRRSAMLSPQAAEPQLRDDVRWLHDRSSEVASRLDGMAAHPGDRDAARADAQALRAAAQATEENGR
jgi:DNA-binding transcriptional regulator YdaS (Cro superfamily)